MLCSEGCSSQFLVAGDVMYLLLRPDNDGGQGAQVGWVALVWTRRARVGHYDSVRDHYSIGDRASGLWGDLGGLGGGG